MMYTFTVPVDVFYGFILAVEIVIASLCLIGVVRRDRRKKAARNALLAEIEINAKAQETIRQAKAEKDERSELEKMFPTLLWLNAYDTCKALKSYTLRMVWIRKWLSQNAGKRRDMMLPLAAINEFALMIADSEHTTGYTEALEALNSFLTVLPEQMSASVEPIKVNRDGVKRLRLTPGDAIEFVQRDGKQLSFVAHENHVVVTSNVLGAAGMIKCDEIVIKGRERFVSNVAPCSSLSVTAMSENWRGS